MAWNRISVSFFPPRWQYQCTENGELTIGQRPNAELANCAADYQRYSLSFTNVATWFLHNETIRLKNEVDWIHRFTHPLADVMVSTVEDEVMSIIADFRLTIRSNEQVEKWVGFILSWPTEWKLRIIDGYTLAEYPIDSILDRIILSENWKTFSTSRGWDLKHA